MFLQDLYDSKIDEKYKKLAAKLFKEYAVDVSIYESFGKAELTLFLEELEAKKNTIILESGYGDHVSNPEYAKTVLLSEAIRMFLREIAPKRLKRRTKKVDETLDYKVHSPTGAAVDYDIDDDEERPDLYWRKHQWEEERSLANHPVDVMDSPPAGEAYVDDVSMAHNCDGEKMQPYAGNAQPVGGTAENEQQAGVYVAVMNPDRFLGDKEVNVMAIEPQVKSQNDTSILTRKVKPAVIDVNDIDSYQNEFESEEENKMTDKSMIEGLSELLDTSILEEGELQRAEMVFATNDVIIRLTKMIEDLSKIATEDVLGLVDGVRMNFGPEEAEQFSKMAEINIQSSADGIQKFKERLETYRDKFEARISDEDSHVPLETVAPEETGEEMPGSAPAVPPAVPDLTAPPAGEGDGQEVGDELTDLLGGEDGKATEEPLGRAKKEGRVVMVAGKRIRLSEEQIKSLWQARIITETIRRRVEGNPVKIVTPEVVTEKSTVVVIGGHKVRLSEQQFKALVFAKNFRNIVESKGANVVKLSESQAKRLQYAKLVTERISKMLAEKKWIKTDPSEKGKYKGKTVADLEKMKSALEKKNASRADRGEKVPQEDRDKMSELNFALRAKRGHGFKEGMNEEKWIKTDPSERGKYKGKTIADLEKMKSDLEKQNANREERGEKVPQADREKMAELNFALRAKRGHGFKEGMNEEKWIKTDPSEKGKYKGKTIADLEKMKSDLEKQNANREERGEKVPQADREKMAELNFAIRAKRGHGFKEDVAEGKAKRDVDAIMAKKRAKDASDDTPSNPMRDKLRKQIKSIKDASDDKPSNPMRDKLRKQIKSIKGEEVDENCGKKHGKKK